MTGSGHSLLIFALMALVASLFCYLPGLLKNGGFPKKAARWLYVLFSLLVWTAAVWLFILFVRHRFQYTYVAGFSSRELPLGYLLSAVWAGQEGSFLIWVAFAAVLGLSFFRRTARLEAPGMVVFELSLVFLMALLIKQSPFRLSPEIPADGNGLNPLLQDFWMSIHPPLIFLGYAAYAIPFSLAMASCWTGDRKEWLSPALVWANVGFLTLGAGIIVGGFWAYKVLGWGGYWGWDPVENASLLPWLTGTALIHGLVMQRVQDRFSRGNIMLASVSFLLVLYGTFLTRSGVLANFSVHSFTDLGITGWLVWYILFFVFLSLGMLGWRWRRFRVEGKPVPFWSREMSFFLMILVLLMSTVLVGLGTSAPLLTGFTENPSSVTPSFYNRTQLPIGVLLALLVAIGPLLDWGGKGGWRSTITPLAISLLSGLAVSIFLLLSIRYPGPWKALLLWTAFSGLSVALLVGWRNRKGGIWLYAGPLSHAGLALMLAGIVLSGAMDASFKMELPQGQPTSAADGTFTFSRIEQDDSALAKPELLVESEYWGRKFMAAPTMYYDPRRNQQYANPHIERFWKGDLYIEPLAYQPPSGSDITGLKGREGFVYLEQGTDFEGWGYRVQFVQFNVAAHEEFPDGAMGLGAILDVASPEGARKRVEPLFVLQEDEPLTRSVLLPGGEDRVSIAQVLADQKAVVLHFEGPGIDPDAIASDVAPAIFTVQIKEKPLISLLWLGVSLMLLGSTLAVARRYRREAAKAD